MRHVSHLGCKNPCLVSPICTEKRPSRNWTKYLDDEIRNGFNLLGKILVSQ